MTGINLSLLLLIISLSTSLVNGKHNYFEEYFSKYHHYHKSSSTAASVSSTPEISTSDILISSNQGESTSKDPFSSEDDTETDTVGSSIQNGSPYYQDGSVFVARVAIIVGSIIFVVVVLGCIVCCCPKCRGTQRRGYIVGSTMPPQSITTPVPPQPEIVQHMPPDYATEAVQQFPPQYQQPMLPPMQYTPMQQPGYQYSPMQQPTQYSPVQPQTQYSPVQPQTQYSPVLPGYQNPTTLQFHNPPEAPPPYEFKASHQ